jgi:alkanesulfonate monooxygenase SsuD/methylene tetrahydromethanopterin reductase-like flavin-dependent oxidoreductase (luciferase family)
LCSAVTALSWALRYDMPESVIRSAARLAEDTGYECAWINNPPGRDGLAPVAWAADATSHIDLGTGVVPVSHHSPADILRRVNELGLPGERYRLGIGSGWGPHPVDRVRAALRELRPAAGCELVVGALGPRMCTLAGEEADAVLLNAVTPASARRSAELARAAAAAAGRPAPRIYVLVLAGLGEEFRARLDQAAAFYTTIPSYARHFARLGLAPADVMLAAGDLQELGAGLAAWRGVVDEVVVGIPPDPERPDEVLRLLEPVRTAWQASAGR